MKYSRTLLLLMAVAACALPCPAQSGKPSDAPPPPPPPAAEYNPKAWKEFSPPGGNFTVLLPGVPAEKVEARDTPVGKLLVHNYTMQTFAHYGIMYVDYPANVEEGGRVKEFLDGVRDGGVKALGGVVLEEKEATLDGHPGRFVRVRVGDDYVMRLRTVVVKNRLYQLGITMREKGAPEPIARFHDETAAKFLDSFRLVGGATTQADAPPATTATANGANAETGPAPTRGGEVDRYLQDKSRGPVYGTRGGVQGDEVKVLHKPQPAYPAMAKAARAQGAVVVQVIVDEEGKVVAAQAVSGHPLLQAAAVEAARGALFARALVDGKPVKVAGVITYNFELK